MSIHSESLLRALNALPIQDGYYDIWGNFHRPSERSLRGILKALHFTADNDAVLERELAEWESRSIQSKVRPVYVLRGDERKVEFHSSVDVPGWILRCEDGTVLEGRVEGDGRAVYLPREISIGYHELEVDNLRTKIIVCPNKAYLPDGKKRSGLSVQLYSLHSKESEGMGDFSDLKSLANWISTQRGSFVGLNPLHALFPHDTLGYSPYSPSSRRALNPLYIRTSEIDGKIGKPETSGDLIDYGSIAKWKFERLDECFSELQRQGGEELQRFNEFCKSVDEHTKNFAKHSAFHSGSERFHLYCQWIARKQLSKVADDSSLSLGLYLDLAVGVNPNGAEVWEDPELFAVQASSGAPPDLLNVQGQVWGLAPYIPWELEKRAYQPFIETLRFNMQYAGALRIDHIMALQRLFWVPSGMTGQDGIYIKYPLRDLMGIVALESVRNECIVVGEDLGTVPDEIREEMRKGDILSYKVLYFMKHYNGDGSFINPEEYPEKALVTASTHDLPTIRGFLESRDLEVRKPLGLFSESCTYDGETAGRKVDVENLIKKLLQYGYHDGDLNLSIQRFLSRTPCLLRAIQIEDLLSELDQANLPGTVAEHPNWRRKLSRSLEEILRLSTDCLSKTNQ